MLQGQLIPEIELWEIKEISEANTFLKELFIKDYNRRFPVRSETAQPACRKVSRNVDIESIISFCYQAVGGNDNTVRLGGMVIDIPEGPRKRGYAKQR